MERRHQRGTGGEAAPFFSLAPASVASYSSLVSNGDWGPAVNAAITDAVVSKSYVVNWEAGEYDAFDIALQSGVTLRGVGDVIVNHATGTGSTPILRGETRGALGSMAAGSTALTVNNPSIFSVDDRLGVIGAGGPNPYQYSTLDADISSDATSLTIDSATGWDTAGGMYIDNEYMTFTRSGTAMTVTRGGLGTAAAPHSAGARVSLAMALHADVVAVNGAMITLSVPAVRAVTSATVTRGVRDAAIRGITFDGNKPDTPTSTLHAIYLEKANRVTIEDCTIRQVAHGGVMSGRGSKAVVVRRCILDGIGYSAEQSGAALWAFEGAELTVEDSRITNCYAGPIWDDRSTAGTPDSRAVSNCAVIRTVIEDCDVGIVANGAADGCIAGNTIRNCDRGMVVYGVAQGTEAVPTENITIDGNYLANCPTAGIQIQEVSDLIIVTDSNYYENAEVSDTGENPVGVSADGFEWMGIMYVRTEDENGCIRFVAAE